MAGEQTEKEVIDRIINDYNEKKNMTINEAISAIETFLTKLNTIEDGFKFEKQRDSMLEKAINDFGQIGQNNNKWKLDSDDYKALTKSQRGVYSNIIATINRFSQAAQIVQNKSIENTQNITKQNLVIEGYALINKITETIRGQEVLYDISYIDDNNNNKQIITLRMTLSELLQNLISVNTAGDMRIDTTRAKQLALNSNISKIQKETWQTTRIDNYMMLLKTVQNIEFSARSNYIWGKTNKARKTEARATHQQISPELMYVNEGNIMEAFREIEIGIQNGKYSEAIFQNKKAIYKLLKQVQRNTTSFAHGGDITYKNEQDEIFDVQLKNANASITDLDTVFRIIMRLYNQLQTAVLKKGNDENTELSKLNGQIRSAINETLDNLRKEIKGSK